MFNCTVKSGDSRVIVNFLGDKKSLLLPGVSLLSQGFDQTSICRAVFTEVGGLP